jgi:ACS family D-galactonate transporter-like MFS transporter
MSMKVQQGAWWVVIMLFLFMLINFADKAVLGLSAVQIIGELKLSHTEFGAVGSSFFAFFSIGAVLVGFFVNRASAKWTLAAMALVWSCAQLPMLLTFGLPMLIANRVLLGAGEGPAYPVALHATYKWFASARRPMPTAIISLGGAVGTGIAAPAITFLIVRYSWHAAFFVLGLLGLVWLAVWTLTTREGPIGTTDAAASPPAEHRIAYRDLLTCRTFLGAAIIGFGAYWMLTLAFVWLPAYLVSGVGYTPSQAAWIITLPALVQIVTQPSICSIAERLRLRGVSSRLANGMIAGGSVLLAGTLAAALPYAPGTILPIVCVALAFSIGSVVFALGHVLVAEVTPQSQRGAMLGINNAVATLAGIVAPIVMGRIVDVGANAVEGFRTGFLVTGLFVAACALIGMVLINPEADLHRFGLRRDPQLPSAVPADV